MFLPTDNRLTSEQLLSTKLKDVYSFTAPGETLTRNYSSFAESLHDQGFCALPASDQKRPVANWKIYQAEDRPPTSREIPSRVYDLNHSLYILSGVGGLAGIDIDEKYNTYERPLSHLLFKIFNNHFPGVLQTAYWQKSRSGGKHIFWTSNEPPQKMVLAKNERGEEFFATQVGFIISPSPGYTALSGSLLNLPHLTIEQQDCLLDCAQSLSKYKKPQEAVGSRVSEAKRKEVYRQGEILRPFIQGFTDLTREDIQAVRKCYIDIAKGFSKIVRLALVSDWIETLGFTPSPPGVRHGKGGICYQRPGESENQYHLNIWQDERGKAWIACHSDTAGFSGTGIDAFHFLALCHFGGTGNDARIKTAAALIKTGYYEAVRAEKGGYDHV